jgi:pimeloyl-ACP methyl ester carboxylesterase
MINSIAEFDEDVAKDISISNECFLLGYSQGGWATLALLEEMEKNYETEFPVKAATCGAGPYDLSFFNSYVLSLEEYPMPVFLGYISNAYSEYDLFTNPLSDLYNGTYAGLIPGLYDGMHSSDQINSQLTVSITELFTAAYITGYADAPAYLGVRNALSANSISGWDSNVPILFVHGTADDYVMPELSVRMHDAMTAAGSSPLTCIYIPLEDLDHSEGSVPSVLAGLEFFKTYR